MTKHLPVIQVGGTTQLKTLAWNKVNKKSYYLWKTYWLSTNLKLKTRPNYYSLLKPHWLHPKLNPKKLSKNVPLTQC